MHLHPPPTSQLLSVPAVLCARARWASCSSVQGPTWVRGAVGQHVAGYLRRVAGRAEARANGGGGREGRGQG